MNQNIIEKTEKLLRSIGIPSQPRILLEIEEEVKKEDPNIDIISDLASRDVGMSAKIIKVCNSPYFGLRQKVETISRALRYLGLKNFRNLILASALQDNLKSNNISSLDFEYFCNHSLFTARIAQSIAVRVSGETGIQIDPNHAYMAGLFHDCSIPLLTKRYKDYFKKVSEALKSDSSMITVEEMIFQTNHCIAANLVAKTWHLPESVCIAIKNHHNANIKAVDDPVARKLLAVLMLAESIIYYKDTDMTYIFDIFNFNVGEENYGNLASELELTQDDIADIEDSVDKILDMTV